MPKISQSKLDGKVLAFIRDRGLVPENSILYVALSGGPDSVCLFDILYNLKDKLKIEIRACHFNHKVRGVDSEKDKDFVIQLTKKYGVPLEVGERDSKNAIKNELDARNLRYAYFEKILKFGGGDLLALGHNANDTAETMLMRIIRGSGLKGLSSILPRRKKFIRPLLPFSRDEILEYLKSKNIKYRTDKTNLLPLYTRNQIRLEIIPELKKYNPNIIETLAREASSLATDYEFIQSEALKLKNKFSFEKGEYSIHREEFLRYHPSLQRESIRLILEELVVANDVTEDQINKCILLIAKGSGGKILVLPHSLRLTLKGGKIYVFNIADLSR